MAVQSNSIKLHTKQLKPPSDAIILKINLSCGFSAKRNLLSVTTFYQTEYPFTQTHTVSPSVFFNFSIFNKIFNVSSEDKGAYWCGVKFTENNHHVALTKVKLKVEGE